MKSRTAKMLLISLLPAICLFAAQGPSAAPVAYDYREDPNVTSWLTKKGAERLMRYHGAQGLKITENEVFIQRDNRWICVYHDPPYPLEMSIVSGTSRETVLAHAER